jgi:hypothetical protein
MARLGISGWDFGCLIAPRKIGHPRLPLLFQAFRDTETIRQWTVLTHLPFAL